MVHLVKATEVTAGLAESNGSLLPGLWRDSLHVTCGMTACTPGSAPGPTLGNEYGKTLPFLLLHRLVHQLSTRHCLLLSAVACYQSISPARGALSSKLAACHCCCQSKRQTDGWMRDCFIDPAPHGQCQ